MNNLGERLRLIRVIKNLTQLELAQKVNMSRVQINNIERGKHNTKVSSLVTIAKALDVDITVFFVAREVVPSLIWSKGVSNE